MRPIKLVMTGFESYKDRTEISFEKLGSKGLYLITGDTGAGKTTIFDAITFALYGKASGDDRNPEMLRSHFADEKTPTVVELDFESNGKKYHIKRNPDYQRKALRGEGITTETANAELFFSDDVRGREPVTGVSKVNAEIENILNLKREQFCSIAMIAQGRFQELLLSRKEQKQELFRELFHTEKYERLQLQLKKDRSEADGVCRNLQLRLNEALGRIEVNENDADAEKIKLIKTTQYVKEEEIEALKAFVKKDEKLLEDVLKQISSIENQLEKTNAELQRGEARQLLEDQCKSAMDLKTQKEQNLKALVEAMEAAAKEAEKVPEFEKEQTLLEASLKDYQEIAEAEKVLNNLSKEIFKAEEQQETYEAQKNQLEETLEKGKKELAELKNAGEKIGSLKAALEKISEEENALEDIGAQLEDLADDIEALNEAQNKAKAAIDKSDELQKDYTEKLRLFNLEQAGILAETLKEGEPCPVCGSTEHPKPASKSSEAPTQAELEDAQKKAASAAKTSTDLSVKAAEKNKAVEKGKEQINKELKKYFEALTIEDQTLTEKLKERKQQLENDLNKTNNQLEKEEADKKRRDAIENAVPEQEAEIKKITDAIGQLSAKISGDKGKLEEGQKNLEAKKSGLKYSTLEDAQNKNENLKKQILQLKNNVEAAKNAKLDCDKEIEGLKGRIGEIENQLKQSEPVDMEKLTAEKDKLTAQKEVLGEQRDAINKRSGINQESVRTVETLVPEIAEATDRLNMIGALCDVAVGSNRGSKGKPSLETYVQMHCLDQINRRANLRLKKMTDNKYELRRRMEEDGSELGLDLNVKDFYTGRERNVQTLSGGEQFQASLSLALGLADEIQDNAGGIKLDAMFIDEGFGTLDSETLNKAVRALEDLSQGEKLVGIISHVEELEARIPKKICVKKDEAGVSHASIVTE